MHPGNLFVDAEGRLVAVDFGIMGRLGLKERRFLAEILLGFILRDYRRVARGAFRGRLRAAASLGRRFRAGDPRHRRADPRPARRRDLDGEAADAAVRDHRPLRHDDAHRARHAAEDDGGRRRRRAQPRSEARHVDDLRAGGARMDRAPSRPGRPHRECGPRPCSRLPALSPICPTSRCGPSAC